MFAIAIAAIILVAVVGGMIYVRNNEQLVIKEQGLASARECAEVIELMFDEAGEIDINWETYNLYRNLLRELCKNDDMTYMYAFYCFPGDDEITYYVCVASDDEEDARIQQTRAYGTTVQKDFNENVMRALDGEDVYEPTEFNNQFGNMYGWYSLVPGTDGKVLAGADYSVGTERQRVANALVSGLAPVVLALLALLVVQLFFLNRRVFKPVSVISERMRNFSADHAADCKPLDIASHDEMREMITSCTCLYFYWT